MKKYSILFFAITLLFAISCTKKDGLLNFKLDTAFDLKQSEVATWEDNSEVKVQFNNVLEDSRCPIDAICVWAGRATVEITFSQPGSSETGFLALGDFSGTNYTDKAVFGNYEVILKAVKPAPKAGIVIPASEYIIEIEVRKGA